MSDEIKPSRNIDRVVPLNPSRGTGARKNPRKFPSNSGEQKRRQPPADDQPHQVDEYV